MFGPMPAHGFFIRHARAIDMDGVKIVAMKADERPAFVLEDVENACFTRVQAPSADATPVFILKDVNGFRVQNSPPLSDTQLQRVRRKEIVP